MPAWFHADHGWWARLLLQRGLGLVYFIAFIVALTQFRPLLGEHGLLPVPRFVARVPFWSSPSLFHFRYSDRLLVAVAAIGAALSLVVLVGLPDRWPVALTMAIWLMLLGAQGGARRSLSISIYDAGRAEGVGRVVAAQAAPGRYSADHPWHFPAE